MSRGQLQHCFVRPVLYSILVGALALSLVINPLSGRADDAPLGTPIAVEAETPTSEPTEPAAPPATELPTDAPSPTPTPTAPAEPEPPEDDAVVDAHAPEPAERGPVPRLSYAPAERVACETAPAGGAEVALRGAIEYRCSIEIGLSGEGLDPASIAIAWLVRVEPGAGWQAQLQAAPDNQDATPRWTDHSGDSSELRGRVSLADRSIEQDGDGAFSARVRVTVGLRLWRMGCDASAPSAAVTAQADAVAGAQDASIVQSAPQPESMTLRPTLLPIAAPSIAFDGGLRFDPVVLDAMGVRSAPSAQAIDMTVSGLDAACGAWSLNLAAEAFSSDGGAGPALRLVAIDGEQLARGGCDLADGCRIAAIEANPDQASSVTYTLSIALELPELLPAADFSTTISATLTEMEPAA